MSIATKFCAALVDFGVLTGHTGTINVIAIGWYSASSGGTYYGAGSTGVTIPVNSGDAISFAINAITIKLRGAIGSDVNNTDALAFLDNRYGSGSPGTLYAALFSVLPTNGSGGTEFVGGTYARIAITNNNTNFPAASMV